MLYNGKGSTEWAPIIVNTFSKISNLNETTCSMDAYHRGEGQKVIGFSYYRVKDKSKVKHKNCR